MKVHLGMKKRQCTTVPWSMYLLNNCPDELSASCQMNMWPSRFNKAHLLKLTYIQQTLRTRV